MNDISHRLESAVRFARQGGAETLKWFGDSGLSVDRKGDGSPVTAADRGAEELLRKLIGDAYPDDAILGEEFPEKPGTSGYQWVLDPIDGTKSFIHGVPLYTTLIAVMDQREEGPDEPKIGVIYTPATGETAYASTGGGCWLQKGDAEPTRAEVSPTKSLDESLFLTSDVGSFGRDRDPGSLDVFNDLDAKCRLARTWGDGYGYLMVASGRAEVIIDPAASLWDIAAMKPIIQEAGGRFTDWNGEPTVHSKEAVASNGAIHDAVLELTRGR